MVNNELRTRIITGTVLVAGFAAIDLLAVYLPFAKILLALLGVVAAAIGSYEVGAFTFRSKSDLRNVSAFILALPATAVFLTGLRCSMSAESDCGSAPFAGAVAFGTVGLFLLITLMARSSLSTIIQAVSTCVLAFLLIGVGGAAFVSMSLSVGGGLLIAWLVLVVAVTDIAAFGIGRAVGGPKLAPAISPGKTISGGVGGIVAAGVIGGVSREFLVSGGSWLFSIALAILVSVAAQNGDLMKSILKRLWGVKDSGTILPGHGGVLDRIDGMLGGALMLFVALQCGFFSQP